MRPMGAAYFRVVRVSPPTNKLTYMYISYKHLNGRIDGWMDGWTDGRMNGRMDGWMDGWMDG